MNRMARAVRQLAMQATTLVSSSLSIAEVACVFHRHLREGGLDRKQATRMRGLFRTHLEQGVWSVAAVSDAVLSQVEVLVAKLLPEVHVRAGDAIHLVTAQREGFTEIWSNDRRLLAAAPHFGLKGRSV